MQEDINRTSAKIVAFTKDKKIIVIRFSWGLPGYTYHPEINKFTIFRDVNRLNRLNGVSYLNIGKPLYFDEEIKMYSDEEIKMYRHWDYGGLGV